MIQPNYIRVIHRYPPEYLDNVWLYVPTADKNPVRKVCHWPFWTPMVENYLRSQGNLGKGRKNVAALHPLGRVGEPDDIAHGILYLASDEAKFVTGSELVIDGGYTAQ